MSSSAVNCAPRPETHSWKPRSRTSASVRSVDAVLLVQIVGVDLEHHVLRDERLVERVELADGDDGGVGQLAGGAAEEQQVVGLAARRRRVTVASRATTP